MRVPYRIAGLCLLCVCVSSCAGSLQGEWTPTAPMSLLSATSFSFQPQHWNLHSLVADYQMLTLHNRPTFCVSSVFIDAWSHSWWFWLCLGTRNKDREVEEMHELHLWAWFACWNINILQHGEMAIAVSMTQPMSWAPSWLSTRTIWSKSHRQLNIFLERIKRAQDISLRLWSHIMQVWARTCILNSALYLTRHGEADRTEAFLVMVMH